MFGLEAHSDSVRQFVHRGVSLGWNIGAGGPREIARPSDLNGHIG
jgi:hypothetical protein